MMKRASRKVGTIEPNEVRSCGPGKGRALYPQVWPQSQLSLTYIRKAVPYDNLSLAEFAARFACILRLPSLSATERDAHTEHFTTLMYLATQVSWPAVCSLYAAVLFEIECGRLRCGHSFAHLEARLLHGQANCRGQLARQLRNHLQPFSSARLSKPAVVPPTRITMVLSEMSENGCNIFVQSVGSQSRRCSVIQKTLLCPFASSWSTALPPQLTTCGILNNDSARTVHKILYILVWIMMTVIYIVLVMCCRFHVLTLFWLFQS